MSGWESSVRGRGKALTPGVLAVFVALGFLGHPREAQADVLVLRTGYRVHGEIESETPDAVVIAVARGKLTFRRELIASIQRSPKSPSPARAAASLPWLDGGAAPAASPSRVPSPESPPTVAEGQMAWEAPVSIEARGSGISTVRVTLRSRADEPVSVVLPAGCVYVAREWGERSRPQDMLAVGDVVTQVPADGQVEVKVPVACAKLALRVPTQTDLFDLRRPDGRRLAFVAGSLRSVSNPRVRQAAVWIVSDDADYEALGKLRTSSGLGTRTYRAIRVGEAACALRIVDASGIDVRRCAIWNDRFLLLHALSPETPEPDDEAVRAWAQGHWRALGYPADLSELLERILADRSASLALHAEAFRVALRERRTGLVPTLKKRLAAKPEFGDRRSPDSPARALAQLQVLAVTGPAGGPQARANAAPSPGRADSGDLPARIDGLLALLGDARSESR